MTDECPGCGTDLNGGKIPKDIVHHYVPYDVAKKGSASVSGWLRVNPWPTFKKRHGIEVRGVYDGVLVWQCIDCNHMWPRFPKGGSAYLYTKGMEYIESENRRNGRTS
jgi:hypothetical protein